MAGVDVLLLLLGALLALGASVVVQLVVIPEVDRARRREDRWERDVLALGEILSVGTVQTLSGLRRALAEADQLGGRLSAGYPGDPRTRQAASKVQGAANDLSVVAVRISWLITRVSEGPPGRIDVESFASAAKAFEAALVQYHVAAEFDSVDMTQVDADHEAARGAGRELLRETEALARALGR